MDYQFEWLLDSKLAMSQRPGYPWSEVSRYQVEKFVTFLKKKKIQTVVCFLTAEELRTEFIGAPLLTYQELGLSTHHLPTPHEENTEAISQAVSLLETLLQSNQVILFHGQSKEDRILKIRDQIQEKLKSPAIKSSTPQEQNTAPAILLDPSPLAKNLETYLQTIEELKTIIETHHQQNRLDSLSFSQLEQLLLSRKSSLVFEQKEYLEQFASPTKTETKPAEILPEAPLVTAKKKQTDVIEKKKLLLQSISSHHEETPMVPVLKKEPPPVVPTVVAPIISEEPKGLPVPPTPKPKMDVSPQPSPKPKVDMPSKRPARTLFKFKEVLAEAPSYFIKPQKQQQLATLLPILYEKALWFLGSLFILLGAIYWVSNAWSSMQETHKLLILLASVLGLQSINFFAGVFLDRSLGLKSGGQNLKISAMLLTPLLFVLWGELCTKSLNWQVFFGATSLFAFYFARSTLKDFDSVFRQNFLFFFILYNLWQVPVSFVKAGFRELFCLIPLLTVLPLCQRYATRVLPHLKQAVSLHTNLFYSLLSYLYLFTLGHLYFRLSQEGSLSFHGYSLMMALLGSCLLLYANGIEESRRRFTLFSGIGLTLTLSSIFLTLVSLPKGKIAIPGQLVMTLSLLTVTYWKASFLFLRTYLFMTSLFLSLSVYFLAPGYFRQEWKALGHTFSWVKNTFGYQQDQRLPLSYYPITFLPFLLILAWYSWKNRPQWKPSFYRAVHQLFAGIALVFTVFLVQGSWTDSRPALMAVPLYIALFYGFFRLFHNVWYEMGAWSYLFLWTWYLSYPAPFLIRATYLLLPFLLLIGVTQRTSFEKLRQRREHQIYFYYHLIFLMLSFFQAHSPLFPASFYLFGALGLWLSFRFIPHFSPKFLAFNSIAHFAILSLLLGAYLSYLFLGSPQFTLWHKLLGGYPLAQGLWMGIASIVYALLFARIASLQTPPLVSIVLQGYAGFSVATGYLFVSWHAMTQFFWPFQILFLGQSLTWIGALKLLNTSPTSQETESSKKQPLTWSHLAILPLLTSMFFCSGWMQQVPATTFGKESLLNFLQILLLFGIGYSWKKLELLQLSAILFPLGCWLVNRSFLTLSLPIDLLWVSISLFYAILALLPQVKNHPLLSKTEFRSLALFLYAIAVYSLFSIHGSVYTKTLYIPNFALFTITALLFFVQYQSSFCGILSFFFSLVLMVMMKEKWHFHEKFYPLYLWGLAIAWFSVLYFLERFSFAVAQKKLLSWFPLLPAFYATFLLYTNNISSYTREINDLGLLPSGLLALFGVHVIWMYTFWRKFYWAQYFLLPSVVLFIMLLYASGITPILMVSEVFVQCSLIPIEFLFLVFLLSRRPNIPEKAYQGMARSSQIFAGILLLSLTLVRIDPLFQYTWLEPYSMLEMSRNAGFAKYLEIYRTGSLLALFFFGYWFWKKQPWMLCATVLSTALLATGSLDQAQASPPAYSLYFALSGALLLFSQKSYPELRLMGWLSAFILPCFFFYEVRYYYDGDWLLRLLGMAAFALCFAIEAGIYQQLALFCGAFVCFGITFGFYLCHGFFRQDVFNCIVATAFLTMLLTLFTSKRAPSFHWKHLSFPKELTQQSFQLISMTLILLAFSYECGLFVLRQLPQGSSQYPLPAKLWIFGISHIFLITGLLRHAWIPQTSYPLLAAFFLSLYTPLYRFLVQEPFSGNYYPAGLDWAILALVLHGAIAFFLKAFASTWLPRIDIGLGILLGCGLLLTYGEIHAGTVSIFLASSLFFLIDRKSLFWNISAIVLIPNVLYFYGQYLVTGDSISSWWSVIPLGLTILAVIGPLVLQNRWSYAPLRLTLLGQALFFTFLANVLIYPEIRRFPTEISPYVFEIVTLCLIAFPYFWVGRKVQAFQYLFGFTLSSFLIYFRGFTPFLPYFPQHSEFLWLGTSILFFIGAIFSRSDSWKIALGSCLLFNLAGSFLASPWGMDYRIWIARPLWLVGTAGCFLGTAYFLIPQVKSFLRATGLIALSLAFAFLVVIHELPQSANWYLSASILGCFLSYCVFRWGKSLEALALFTAGLFFLSFPVAHYGIASFAPIPWDLRPSFILVLMIFYGLSLVKISEPSLKEPVNIARDTVYRLLAVFFLLGYGFWYLHREPLFLRMIALISSFQITWSASRLLLELLGFALFYRVLERFYPHRGYGYASILFAGLFLWIIAPIEHLIHLDFTFSPRTPSIEILVLGCLLVWKKELNVSIALLVLGILSTLGDRYDPVTFLTLFTSSFYFLLRWLKTRHKLDHYGIHLFFLAGIYFVVFYLLPDTGRNKLLVLPLLAIVNALFVAICLKLTQQNRAWLDEKTRTEITPLLIGFAYMAATMLFVAILFVRQAEHDSKTQAVSTFAIILNTIIFWKLGQRFVKPNLYFLIQLHLVEGFLFLRYRSDLLHFVPEEYVAHCLLALSFLFCQFNFFLKDTTLIRSFLLSGMFLPLLSLIFLERTLTGALSQYLLLFGAHYFFMSLQIPSWSALKILWNWLPILFRVVGLLFWNFAFFCFLYTQGWTDPQLYGIPLGITFVAVAEFHRKDLGTVVTQLFRLLGILTMFGSSSLDILNVGNPLNAIIIATIGLLMIGLGFLLNLKFYLLAGAIAIIMDAVGHLILFGVQRNALGSVFLVLLGVVFIIGAIYTSLKRLKQKELYDKGDLGSK